MVSDTYKELASKDYLQHIRDVAELEKNIDAYMFVARSCGVDDKRFAREQEERQTGYAREIRTARRALSMVGGTPQDVLTMWTFEGKSYNTIGYEIGYEVSSVKRLAKQGRRRLYDHLPPEYK